MAPTGTAALVLAAADCVELGLALEITEEDINETESMAVIAASIVAVKLDDGMEELEVAEEEIDETESIVMGAVPLEPLDEVAEELEKPPRQSVVPGPTSMRSAYARG
ncbi:hypothetical protein B0H19DRAFT_1067048 [Mycena capillaripes]|nr:hypothetical protein B0H19DRAFT_1067048 [Mycena capillaripes]